MKKWLDRINHWKLDKKMQVLVNDFYYCDDHNYFSGIHHFLSDLHERKVHRTSADEQ